VDLLARIKRLAIRRKLIWTGKAELQMAQSGITREDVIEAIINAQFVITKISISRRRKMRKERVRIIKSFTMDGVYIYTKGVIRKIGGEDYFYIIISAKRGD